MRWGDKRYHSLNYHLRQRFGTKVFKVPLNAGFTCPNRDGTKGWGGCAFCGPQGAGEFAGKSCLGLADQFNLVREMMHRKWPQAKYIAYFQPFTNTYAPPEVLKQKYQEVLDLEGVVGISIATRPDCLPSGVLEVISEINRKTYLWVELGLQTIHEDTARLLNLGYNAEDFSRALKSLRERDIMVCPHIILGLPGETKEMMLKTAEYLSGQDIQGLKIHLLYVMEGTLLARWYREGAFSPLGREEYVSLVVDILEILPPSVVIHRLTGDSPRESLVAPLWSLNKWEVLNEIDRELVRRDTYQGRMA